VININNLNNITYGYLNERLSPVTRRTYFAGKQCFTSFCNASGNRVLPASESALTMFISHLSSRNISHATIKVCLAAVRYCLHAQTPSRSNSLPDGSWSLGASRELRPLAPPSPPVVAYPLPLLIMCAIKDCLSSQPYSHSNIMLWAACCMAFFGFL